MLGSQNLADCDAPSRGRTAFGLMLRASPEVVACRPSQHTVRVDARPKDWTNACVTAVIREIGRMLHTCHDPATPCVFKIHCSRVVSTMQLQFLSYARVDVQVEPKSLGGPSQLG